VSNSRTAPVPLPALRFTIVAMAFSLAPLVAHLTPWVFVVFAIAAATRMWWLRQRPGPPLVANLAILVVGVATVRISYQSVIATDAGLTVLLVLVSIKLLETSRPRDLYVLTWLGYFFCVGVLLFSQDLLVSVYVVGAFVVVTAAALHAHAQIHGVTVRIRPSLVTAGRMVVQALPLVALLFIAFPRIQPFRLQLVTTDLSAAGISDRMTPGSFSRLAISTEPAFRVEFPDGEVPPTSSLYWRGGVLWDSDGMNWYRGTAPPEQLPGAQLGGRIVRQDIILQPHGGRWLFALDRPVTDVPGAHWQPGGYLENNQPIYTRRRYQVTSRPMVRQPELPSLLRHRALSLQQPVTPAVQALVEKWRAAAETDRHVVEQAILFFRREKFVYTLSPGEYKGPDALEEFLFRRKQGFCEHYAGTLATLMRAAGIPARVVIGYQGGEYNSVGNYIIVRQSQAHAWCEVWLEESGWTRTDPTTVVAPERISADFESYRPGEPTVATRFNTNSAAVWSARELARQLRQTWDTLNHQWDMQVLNFDSDQQDSLLAMFGLSKMRRAALLAYTAAAVLLSLWAVWLWIRWRSLPAPDALIKIYNRLGRKLARLGIRRRMEEGPVEFTERACAIVPERADAIRNFTSEYIELRYGRRHHDQSAVRGLKQRLREV
jgi:transglutaminase-like putative cysteine protease